MTFAGFGPDTLAFLADLADNNHKAWFEGNRGRYETALKEPAIAFIEAIGPGIRGLDPNLRIDPRSVLFRIHRDTRFSADKRPYKEELAFRFRGAGEGSSALMMRIRTQDVGVAAGIWAFTPEQIGRYRAAVGEAATGEALALALQGMGEAACGFTAAALKRVPAPFAADHPRGDLLKHKGLTVGMDHPHPPELSTSAFVDWTLSALERLAPAHHWLQSHVG